MFPLPRILLALLSVTCHYLIERWENDQMPLKHRNNKT